MHFKPISLIAGVLGAGAVLTPSFNALSDNVPAVAGRAWEPEQQVCFSSMHATLANDLNTTACKTGNNQVMIPITIRASGTHRFYANGTSDAFVMPWCRAVVSQGNGTFVDQTPSKPLGLARVTLGDKSVPGFGLAHFDCRIFSQAVTPAGSALASVSWEKL